jgi:hypothetical protein
MRQALRQNRARAQTAIQGSVPAPINGWNTLDSIAGMKPGYAVILDNWICRGEAIEMRRGFIEQCTGTADAVETLIAWRGDSAGDKLFACAGANIIDVTTAGALPSAAYASAASARWNYTNFANDAGRFAILVNGAQEALKYDGSSFAVTSITGTSGSITLTPADLKYVMAHKARLHFIEKNTLRVWFLDVNAIAGAAGLLDLGPVFTRGGYLVGLGRLTLDGGVGPDDFACYLTSEGQVAIYQGTDPSDANNWALVGVYNLAKPIGERGFIEFGTDLLVLTEAGVFALTTILRTPVEQQGNKALSQKIGPTLASAAASYGANFGWQLTPYSGRGGLLIVNVPTAELSTSEQYVRSSQGGGWSRFTGIDAFCWETANGEIYFGSTAGVYRWDAGASDNSTPITPDVLPAYQAFSSRGQNKVFTMVRALLRAPSIVRPALQVLTNYDKDTVPTAVQNTVTPGDVSPSDASIVRQDWTGAAGEGYVGSPRMRFSLTGATDSDRVAVTEDLTSLLLLGPAGTDHILTRPNLPLDVEVQCIGFDVLYVNGGPI